MAVWIALGSTPVGVGPGNPTIDSGGNSLELTEAFKLSQRTVRGKGAERVLTLRGRVSICRVCTSIGGGSDGGWSCTCSCKKYDESGEVLHLVEDLNDVEDAIISSLLK